MDRKKRPPQSRWKLNKSVKFFTVANDDIKHCFNEDKSKISNSEISEIILIFNIFIKKIKLDNNYSFLRISFSLFL